MRLFIIALGILLFSVQASAQNLEIISVRDSGAADLAPRLAHKNGVKSAAWIRAVSGSNGDIMFSSSWPGEPAFRPPVKVTSGGKVNATLQRGPEFVVAPNGLVHLVWMQDVDIFYARSTDAGQTWSAPRDISLDDHRATQDFPSIAADSAGNIYVAWVDNRDLVDEKDSNDHVYITRSTDDGTTWNVPHRAENNPGGQGGSCECCRTALAAAGDGHVYIAYRSNINNRRDIFVARSTNGGESFEPSIVMQSKQLHLMACPATGPLIILDRDENLHAVFRTGGYDDKFAVVYNVVLNGAQIADQETLLTPLGDGANYPAIATNETGRIVAAYQRSGRIYSRSIVGSTWDDELPIYSAGKSQKFVWLSSDGDRIEAVWEDNIRDRGDILVAPILTPLAVTDQDEDGAGSDEPNFVTKAGAVLMFEVKADRALEWRVFDDSGREVTAIASRHRGDKQEVTVPELLSGVYYFHCRDRYLYYKIMVTR